MDRHDRAGGGVDPRADHGPSGWTDRRADILAHAERALASRIRRRLFTRVALGVVPALLLAGVLAMRPVWPSGSTTPPVHAGNNPPASPIDPARRADADPVDGTGSSPVAPDAVLARHDAARAPAWATIDDDQLLALLEQAGRPSGLVRRGDRVMLIGRPATGG